MEPQHLFPVINTALILGGLAALIWYFSKISRKP
jgi:hypothetical protein